MAELVINIIAEQIQKEHVAENVHYAAVQKSITHVLPQMRVDGSKHKLNCPGPKKLLGSGKYVFTGQICYRKTYYVDNYQSVICVWRPLRRNTCANG